MWKALVYDPYSNMKLLRPLLKRLQDEDPNSEIINRRHSKSVMPLAVQNRLAIHPDVVGVGGGWGGYCEGCQHFFTLLLTVLDVHKLAGDKSYPL